MELEQDPQNEETDLISRAHKATSQSPPPVVLEPVPREQGYVFLLDDDLVMDAYNLLFDKLKDCTSAKEAPSGWSQINCIHEGKGDNARH